MEKNKNKELTPAEKKQFIEMYEQQQQDKRLLSKLRDNFRLANTEYSKVHRRMRKLDAVDNGDLWKTLAAKYPKYQILPDTNLTLRITSLPPSTQLESVRILFRHQKKIQTYACS